MSDLVEVPQPDDDKYVTFKRADLMELIGDWSAEYMRTVEVPKLLADVEAIQIADAVVIRRQDYMASPALGVYASVVGHHAVLSEDPKRRAQLLVIADYFQRQSELAGDEAWKFPDL